MSRFNLYLERLAVGTASKRTNNKNVQVLTSRGNQVVSAGPRRCRPRFPAVLLQAQTGGDAEPAPSTFEPELVQGAAEAGLKAAKVCVYNATVLNPLTTSVSTK